VVGILRAKLATAFHPYVPVSEEGYEEHIYASRHDGALQVKVAEALGAPGRQVLLVGDAGVGKTSLVLLACWSFGYSLCRIACGNTFQEMVEEGLARLGERREEEEVEHYGGSGEVTVGVPGVIRMKGKGGTDSSRRFTAYDPGLANQLIGALQEAHIAVLFLDGLEALNGKEHERDTILAIAGLMKAVADRSAFEQRIPTIAVAGDNTAIPHIGEIGSLIGRRAAHIAVPHMPPAELHEIVMRGEQHLGLRFAPDVINDIVSLSDGLPYYVHLFALHAAGWAVGENRDVVSKKDFLRAMPEVLDACEHELSERFELASEKTGTVRMRRRVMEAIAEAENPEVGLGEIRDAFAELFPELSTPARLDRIGDAARGLVHFGVLSGADQGTSRGRYRMTHPLMRAYVRLRRREEVQANREALERLLA
jgi:hypothetical protein